MDKKLDLNPDKKYKAGGCYLTYFNKELNPLTAREGWLVEFYPILSNPYTSAMLEDLDSWMQEAILQNITENKND